MRGKIVSWKSMVIFDTNAILRYILQDNQDMAEAVEQQLSKHICHIPVEVIAEVIYVLSKVYNVERKILAQIVSDITDTNKIRVTQKTVVLHALKIFASSSLDFVDCLLIGYAKKYGHAIFTFDKKLQKYL